MANDPTAVDFTSIQPPKISACMIQNWCAVTHATSLEGTVNGYTITMEAIGKLSSAI